MGTLQRYALGSSLCLAPLLLAACGVVTADDGGLFASVAASGPQAGSGGSGGGNAGGSGGGSATCGNGKVEPGEDCDEVNASCAGCKRTSQTLVGGDNCGDLPTPIRLGLGAGNNFYKGTGDTSAAAPDFSENLCEDQNAGVSSLGPDRLHVVEITSPEGGYLTARLVRTNNATTFDAVVYVRDSCTGPGLFCT
ncbi:MAG TPA: hypothetical protein VFS00_07490, partial [Polyangiaceae bacterium]|nr:hypothetical protein [Polyangiaceae bacterium]